MQTKPVYSQMIAGVGVIVLIISSIYSNNELKSSGLLEKQLSSPVFSTNEKYSLAMVADFEEKLARGLRLQQLYNKNTQYQSKQFYQELAVLKYAQIGQEPYVGSGFIQQDNQAIKQHRNSIVDAVFTDGVLQEGLWAVDKHYLSQSVEKALQSVDS